MAKDYGVQRLKEFGETIFATMSAKAADTGAINLGQGFPDSDGPAEMLAKACEAINSGHNQYAPGRGIMELRQAVARQRERHYGLRYRPEDEVLITVGATEAISATILGLVEPGDDVIVLEPYYDAYVAAIALAGANRIAVPLKETPEGGWSVDAEAIRQAITPRTTMVIINNPHNPTGSVFAEEDMQKFAEVCVEADLLVLSDEVYERLVFDGLEHRPTASYEGMWERTITVSSAAKTYNATGWKTGWALAPATLIDQVLKAKQFTTYVGTTPFQYAVAWALDHADDWVAGMVQGLQDNRDALSAALKDAGFKVHPAAGTYFVVVDIDHLLEASGHTDGTEFCMQMPENYGVAAIPVQVFCDHPAPWKSRIRFAYAKQPAVIEQAVTKLKEI